jgi:hypothetical protein
VVVGDEPIPVKAGIAYQVCHRPYLSTSKSGWRGSFPV